MTPQEALAAMTNPEPLTPAWDAMWEDLRHNATGRPSGIAIIQRHMPLIDAERAARQAPDTSGLRDELEHLYRSGYQPMHNGRPSCPFCEAFVDDEETHTPDCVLRKALADA